MLVSGGAGMNNPHRNARNRVYSREQIVLRHQRGEKVKHIASGGHLRGCAFHKGLRRFREAGPASLCSRSLQPVRPPLKQARSSATGLHAGLA